MANVWVQAISPHKPDTVILVRTDTITQLSVNDVRILASRVESNLAKAYLVGVRWSLETDWPPEFYQLIRVWSEEVEFGVFQVRADYARDRVEMPELQPV